MKLRRRRKLGQKQLGALAGLDQSHISRIEAGKADVPVRTLRRLAAALEVEPSALLDESKPELDHAA
ncbi:MAG: helix-turn-helix transcriptional regulator [Pseudomonadota bacterium]|jgi:transcriptional regulator with XRE-family HTH domain